MRQKTHPEGPELSRIILGAWRWADQPTPLKEHQNLLMTALENGITTIDHADIYGNYECEKLFGKILADNPSIRDKVEIVTKCGIKLVSGKYPDRKLTTYDNSKLHIISSVEKSLTNLATDHIDLLLIHRPNPLMNPDEVAEAFQNLRTSGKVKHFGVSNFTNEQYTLLQSRMDFPLVTNQVELSLTHSDPVFDGTLDFLYTRNTSAMAWSPFGGGSLFSNEKLLADLKPIAEKYDVEIGALVLSWIFHLPSKVLPVVGTTNSQRLTGLTKALNVELTDEDWFLMLRHARGFDIP